MDVYKKIGIVAVVGLVWVLNTNTRCKPECAQKSFQQIVEQINTSLLTFQEARILKM